MVAAADGGTRSSSTLTYDPFGQPLVAEPDNESGALDNGWLGQHERPTDSEFALVYVEMGARAYMPALGRFLQVDPVEGGSANAYDYINQDPSNQFDVDGRFPLFHRDNLRLVIRGGKKALHLFNHHFRFEFTPRQGWHINLDWKHVPTQLRHIFIAPVIDFLSRRPFGPILIIPKDSILEQMLNPSSGPRA
jgi:RHS repeat-associated protein